MELKVSGLDQIPQAAAKLLEYSEDHKIFLFYGGMGAGKTTFIKAICNELGVIDTVSSPTFSIVNEYIALNKTVYHFDFYRIKNQTEALDLGYEDYLYSGNYCLIEWPEKIPDLIPEKFVKLQLLEISENERLIKIQKVN
ncbi:MAG TPA: tRNA (adenosine(37)-N6)-threonylcarbamoyltransferase complex ATPase subunit type 1 TsaE [Pedobacter sp.]|jgi:tRNA threonylcarbamoyladenosine biosynthesis protein TsaE